MIAANASKLVIPDTFSHSMTAATFRHSARPANPVRLLTEARITRPRHSKNVRHRKITNPALPVNSASPARLVIASTTSPCVSTPNHGLPQSTTSSPRSVNSAIPSHPVSYSANNAHPTQANIFHLGFVANPDLDPSATLALLGYPARFRQEGYVAMSAIVGCDRPGAITESSELAVVSVARK